MDSYKFSTYRLSANIEKKKLKKRGCCNIEQQSLFLILDNRTETALYGFYTKNNVRTCIFLYLNVH